eukprot:CAMPEP_0172522490 /NCGR_PEP_ID=MMETSP1066-20121228/293154_1 /TAXON_ID=671091 /ORGANISM="Coscinodiscus wailesii, Strain CCMP2513" /LENGTH=566 /DNA_ID=CAMNT_0013305503 /DNA_START=552 /DNA_END=2249 /DNA_ORIENTATION=-
MLSLSAILSPVTKTLNRNARNIALLKKVPLRTLSTNPLETTEPLSRTKFKTSLIDPASLMTYGNSLTLDTYDAREPSPVASRATIPAPPVAAATTSSQSTPIITPQSFPSSPILVTKPFSSVSEAVMGDTQFVNSESRPSLASIPSEAQEHLQKWTPQMTKIVATIGPTSEQLHVLQNLVRCGLRIMRLNFSHATVEEVELRCKNLDLCKGRHGIAFPERLSTRKNLRAILLDTRGPEIRSGKLRNDHSGKETLSMTYDTHPEYCDPTESRKLVKRTRTEYSPTTVTSKMLSSPLLKQAPVLSTAASSFSTLSSSIMDDTDYADSESVHGGRSSALDKPETEVQKWTPQLTKIVATIGPTSEQYHVLQKLVRCGMRVMRLNFSHATVEEVELRCKNLDMCKGRHGVAFPERMSTRQNLRAVLLDTRGPEIRSGKLRNDHSGKETINLEQGNTITLRTSTHWEEMGSTEKDLFIDYAKLTKCLKPGMKVLLDDGAVVLTVLETNEIGLDGPSVVCRIDNSGELRSRAGVNLPGAVTDLPAITDKDKNDIKYGLTKDIDYIAASFVQS